MRVSKTRVPLDTIIAAFSEGATAEEIAYQYPVVPLADIYAVIGYYLHRKKTSGSISQMQGESPRLIASRCEAMLMSGVGLVYTRLDSNFRSLLRLRKFGCIILFFIYPININTAQPLAPNRITAPKTAKTRRMRPINACASPSRKNATAMTVSTPTYESALLLHL
jgi:hypothetical protein